MKPYGIDLAALVHEVAAPAYDDATLTVRTRGTATASNFTAGTNPTEQDRACKALVEEYDERLEDGMTAMGGRVIVILSRSIEGGAVPKPNDKITIGGVEYRIAEGGVSTDAMAGVYVCRVLR